MNRIKIIQTIAIISILSMTISHLTLIQTFAQTSETWKEYIDPEGEFSMQYPSTWELKPSNRFEATDLTMSSPGGSQEGFVLIQYNIFSEQIQAVLDKYGGDQSDIEEYLDILFPSFLKGFSQSLDKFNQVEKINYNNYKIDGYKAASVVFSSELKGLDFAGLMVWSLLGGKTFTFEFASSQDKFDTLLPIGEKILNSVKILDYENNLENEDEEKDK